MKRGRKREDPRIQAAKGNPGRRKAKTKSAIERMEAQAARDAKMFAESGSGTDLQALPVFLQDKRLAVAQAIWKQYAANLDKLNLLTVLDRHTFSLFCIYGAEFVIANRDVLDNGHTIMVTTIAGSKSKSKAGNAMPRLNPSVDIRDHAAKMMLQLAEKFGFTPLDRARLITGHAMLNDEDTLFGRRRTQPSGETPAAPEDAPSASQEIIGGLNTLDSKPPTRMQ